LSIVDVPALIAQCKDRWYKPDAVQGQ